MSEADRTSNRPSGRMNGGRAMAEMLRLAEVGPMFGMGGFQLLPFYDALGQLGTGNLLAATLGIPAHARAALATMHKLRRSSELGTLADLPKLFDQAPRQIEQLQSLTVRRAGASTSKATALQ